MEKVKSSRVSIWKAKLDWLKTSLTKESSSFEKPLWLIQQKILKYFLLRYGEKFETDETLSISPISQKEIVVQKLESSTLNVYKPRNRTETKRLLNSLVLNEENQDIEVMPLKKDERMFVFYGGKEQK